MKNLLSYLTCFLFGATAFAQVPNGSFEVWNKESVNVLKGWNAQGKHTKVSGPNSSDAVRITTDEDGNIGAVAYVNFSDDLANLQGGFAYSGKPDKLKVNLRYEIPSGDTAAIIISASSSGQTFSFNLFEITGTQNTFVDQEFTISYFLPLTPDSIVLGFVSGNIEGESLPGGWIEVSKAEFLDGSGATMAAIPNGDFSQWVPKISETLDGWNTSTDFVRAFSSDLEPVKKDSNATSGNYSLMLKTVLAEDDTIAGLAFTAKNKNDFDVDQPTFKVDEKHLSIQGKYKYAPIGKDSFTVSAILYFQGSVVATAQFKEGNTTDTFQFFSMDITYHTPLTPDSATLAIFNTDPDVPGPPGTTLWIDELSLKEWTTNMGNLKKVNFEIYPNPSNEITTIKLEDASTYSISILNMNGQLVENFNNIHSKLELNVNNYSPGVYFIEIESKTGKGTKKLIVE